MWACVCPRCAYDDGCLIPQVLPLAEAVARLTALEEGASSSAGSTGSTEPTAAEQPQLEAALAAGLRSRLDVALYSTAADMQVGGWVVQGHARCA